MVRSALCPVLIRRDDELAILEDGLLAARRGEGRFVVLSGEAGIGKTRLVRELEGRAERLGATVLMGGCSEAEISLPYLPFVEAIGNYIDEVGPATVAERLGAARAPLAQLFPQLSDAGEAERVGDPAQGKMRLFESIVHLLTVAARERTVLLAVEDVHWADESTLELLDHLARRLRDLPVMTLLTYRSDELHRRHPFVPTLQAWRRSGAAELIELHPLPEGGVEEMIAAILGSDDVDGELADLMFQRTEGNPFVLEEMLREAPDEVGSGGRGSVRAVHSMEIPETVRDSILLRLSRLDRQDTEVLEGAAVLGRSFDAPTLVALSNVQSSTVHGAISVAVSQQLVEEDPDRAGHYRWRHALTQEAIYEEILTPRRQAIHSQAADALAAAGATRPVDLARHLLGAARFDEAVPVCLAAAEEAERSIAFGEAIGMLERALPHVKDETERARMLCRIGQDHWLNGESARGERFLEEGVGELDRLGERLDAARYRIVYGRCLWEGSKPEEARREYLKAREALEGEGPSADLAMAHVRLAGLDAFELDYQGCLEHSRKAVAIAEEAGADFERVWGLGFVALGLLDSGDHARGFEAMDACYREASEKGYWYVAQNMTFNDIWTRTHTLETELDERLARPSEAGDSTVDQASRGILGSYVRKSQGDLVAAREEGERAVELYRELGYGKMIWRCEVNLAEVIAELGLPTEARAALPTVATRTELQDIVYDAAAHIRSAECAGERDEALERAREIADRAEGLATYRETLAIGVEVLVAAGELEAAERVAEAGERRASTAGASFQDEMRGRLLLARGRPEAAIAPANAAIEAARTAGYPLVELRRRLPLAEALHAGGDPESAASELRAVAEHADGIGAALIRTEADALAARLGIDLPPRPEPTARQDAQPDVVPLGERLVTSLFADVRGYSVRAANAAPQDLAEDVAALYRFARATIASQGGIVDKFAGDAVMATFNVSQTSVDHCIRALEAALGLRDKAALSGLDLGIGIAVGPAILGRGASADNIAVTGVSTNLAARLQAAAEPGEILLSDEAHRRVGPWLAERDLETEREELELKGFDGRQPAYRVPAPRLVETGP